MIQTEYGYVIQYPDGSIEITTFRGLKKNCLRDYSSTSLFTWSKYRQQGFRCVKVIIEVYKFKER